tara:strand:+ start:137 stop:796 length:660 start_codon:yes stop_codon:yes gene_type:complete
MKPFIQFSALFITFCTSSVAFAHHPLGALQMETFIHGFLSGIGHPILGIDHLFFVIIVGITAFLIGHRIWAAASYIIAMVVGCAAMSFGIDFPVKELMIALSLLLVGGMVLSGRVLELIPTLGIFALFGLFHGSAFGNSLAEQESSSGVPVLIGYLLGLSLIQFFISFLAGTVISNFALENGMTSIRVRFSGAMVAGTGLFLTLQMIESSLFNAMGWGH